MISCPFCGSGLNVRDGGISPVFFAWFCRCSRSVARSENGFHVNFYDDFHEPGLIASMHIRGGGRPGLSSLGRADADGDWDIEESGRRGDRERFLSETVAQAVCRKVVET